MCADYVSCEPVIDFALLPSLVSLSKEEKEMQLTELHCFQTKTN